MNRFTSLLALIFLLAMPVSIMAQFTVKAELRPRFEIDNGAIRPHPDTINTGYYVSQRTRLIFNYQKEKYEMRLAMQDIRFWGSGDIYSSTGIYGSSRGLDIQEAWFRLKLCEYSKLTIGRQVLKLDDQRLIAARNWNQWGIAYDALRYNFVRNDWDLNAVVSYNTNYLLSNGKLVENDALFDVDNLMKTFNFIHLNHKFSDALQGSVMTIAAGYKSSESNSVIYLMGTYGVWMKYNKRIFDISAEAYFQNGKAQSGKDVLAYMASVHPGVKAGKVRIGLGTDYFSGDNAENEDYGEKERSFNKMYGAVFKYNGSMNYYSYMKASTRNGGLIDIYPNVSVPFAEKHFINAMFHKFYLANPVFLGEDISDDQDLGAELDLMYNWTPMKELLFQAGFSYYFTTETLEKMRGVYTTGVQPPYWAWVMLTFTPQLFSAP